MGEGDGKVWHGCEIKDFEHSAYQKFSPYPIDALEYDMSEGGCFMFFLKWHDMMLCCDYMNGYAFSDVTRADETGNPNSAWKIITPPFSSIQEALDYPVLDGKSVRQRYAECELYS